MGRGKIIWIEGGEGSGKGSHTNLLVDRLIKKEGLVTVRTREPGGTSIGEKIRTILLDKEHLGMCGRTELFLYEAARAELYDKVVKPSLERGEIVVSDRSCLSSLAYQGYARGLDLDFIEQANRFAMDDVIPDLALIIDVPVETGLEKEVVKDRFGLERIDFHEKVNQAYREIAKQISAKVIPYIEGGMEEMQKQIWSYVEPLLKS